MENNPSAPQTVLVVGATGFLGGKICRQLAENGKKLKALVRKSSDPAKIRALDEMGAETILGDLKDLASLIHACKDVDAVISTATAVLAKNEDDSLEAVDQAGQINLVDAAVLREVKKFVFISFNEVADEFPLQTAKRTIEKKLMQSGLDYTILRPTVFMDIWLSPMLGFDYEKGRAAVYGSGENKISWISADDVASFAVSSLENPAANNSVIDLGGPEALSPHEVVQIFEARTGRFFEVQHIPEEILIAQRAEASNSVQKSFASLMISFARGTTIKMDKTLQDFPVKLHSVRDYAGTVVPQQEEAEYD